MGTDKIEWVFTPPEIDGRYIVKTASLYKEQVMYATIQTSENGKRNWSFNNQAFVAYLQNG